MEFKPLLAQPVPVWVAEIDAEKYEYQPYDPPFTERALAEAFDIPRGFVAFRGVGFDRLQAILVNGVDKEPTTSPIFVSSFDKAWEYGDWPKVVMAFDEERLQHTHRSVTISDISDGELSRLMFDYPTRIEDPSGERLWLTRLPATDPRAGTAYESEYARWIPGDPFEALLIVFIFVTKKKAET